MSSYSLVSVVIPTFNSEGTIEVCLESIKDQIYENAEIFYKKEDVEEALRLSKKVIEWVEKNLK